MEENLYDIGLHDDFLNMTPKGPTRNDKNSGTASNLKPFMHQRT